MESASGVVEAAILVDRHGSWSACCGRLESRALAAESEMRCSHASKVCDRFEDGAGAICCETHALFFSSLGLCGDFGNDTFCDYLKFGGYRLCAEAEVCPCFACSRLGTFFFDHFRTQTSIVAFYAPSYFRIRVRGRTSCVVVTFRYMSVSNSNILDGKCQEKPARVASAAATRHPSLL